MYLFSDIVCILCNSNKNVISRYLATLRLWFLYVFRIGLYFLCTYLFALFFFTFLLCDIRLSVRLFSLYHLNGQAFELEILYVRGS